MAKKTPIEKINEDFKKEFITPKQNKGKLALGLDNGLFFYSKDDNDNVFLIDTKLSIEELREKFKKFKPHNLSIKQFYRILKK